uniref:Uncharacterized protein n=1 Tax=Rousettus aegyptiacus TaxID=9407 RepID=A0A7J8JJ71_ROUAE|nr:hypothetical protein HJG63_010371 [Rousettus aegyptiacus]
MGGWQLAPALLHWLTQSPRWPQCARLSVCACGPERLPPTTPVTRDSCMSWTAEEATRPAFSSYPLSLLPPLPATWAQDPLALLPTVQCPPSLWGPATGLGLGARGHRGASPCQTSLLLCPPPPEALAQG